MPSQWDRQSDEPTLWFYRFARFRLLGPTRSLLAAWRQEQGEQGRVVPTTTGQSAPSAWSRIAAKWHWRERAEAYDAVERQREEERLLASRDEWRRLIEGREWADADRLLREAHRLLDEAVGWSAARVNRFGSEFVESAAGGDVEEFRTTEERDLAATMLAAAKLLQQATSMARLAAGLPDRVPAERATEEKGKATVEDVGRAMDDLTDEELKGIIWQHGGPPTINFTVADMSGGGRYAANAE